MAVVSAMVAALLLLIALVAVALSRSAKRLECARLRDELVDAARLGEIDVTEPRVFWLIDWFDRVASTGRLITAARHATERPASTSLTASLVAALTPSDALPRIGPSWPSGTAWPESFWPEPPSGEHAEGRELQDRAMRYQKDKLRQRPPAVAVAGSPVAAADPADSVVLLGGADVAVLRTVPAAPTSSIAAQASRSALPALPALPKQSRVDVTGHPKPPGALMPVSGPIPMPSGSAGSAESAGRRSRRRDDEELKKKIFAVAGQHVR